MNIKKIFIYKITKKIYYYILIKIYNSKGIKININGYLIRFYPKYYKWYPQDYEKKSFEMLKKYLKMDSVCIDIGAHFGIFSIILAKYFNCEVYAFEPTPYTKFVLLKNIMYNKINTKIKVFQCAISSQIGESDFLVQRTAGSVANSLVNYWHSNEEKNKIKVTTDTIDNRFLEIKFDFLKIDAEGVEYDVLVGATEAIRKYSPVIMLALHPDAIEANGQNLKLIWSWIAKEKYICLCNEREIDEQSFCHKKELFDVFLVKSNYLK